MRILFFGFLICVTLLVSLGMVAHSFFTSVATSDNNTFTTAEQFITPTPGVQTADHLIINEVSPEGGNDDDWIELFNPTSNAVDISGWKLHDNNSVETIPNGTSIPANAYGVIVASPSALVMPGSAVKIQLNTSAIGNGLSSDGDKLILNLPDDSTNVDSLSWGINADVFNPAIDVSLLVSGKTISRNPNGIDTDTISDWVIQTQTIGVSN